MHPSAPVMKYGVSAMLNLKFYRKVSRSSAGQGVSSPLRLRDGTARTQD
jgi:hypothetical protein